MEDQIKDAIFYNHSKVSRLLSMEELHYHNHYELYYLLSGMRTYFIESRIVQVQPGDIVLIPSGVLHRTTYASSGGHERLLINFKDDGSYKEALSCFSRSLISIPQINRRQVEDLFLNIEREYTNGGQFSQNLIKCYLYELLVTLCRIGEQMEEAPAGTEQVRIIKEAAEYINSHWDSDLTLQHMAERAAMSTGYFSKLFKRVTGCNFIEYLTHVRIMNACRLLSETTLPVTDIAVKAGFNDSNYFSTVFKRIKGITPVKFRRSSQQ